MYLLQTFLLYNDNHEAMGTIYFMVSIVFTPFLQGGEVEPLTKFLKKLASQVPNF